MNTALPSSRPKFSLLIASAFLVAASLAFRLPALLNARDVNSDAAVVGLQAMHMLHGEWSWFLWGVGYQSSLDSAVTAIAFACFGASPLVLMLMPILGHLIITLLAFELLVRRLGTRRASIVVLPLVITPWAITYWVISPPRQWCVALIFGSIWLLDGASSSRGSILRYALGTMTALLAIFVDLFAMVFAPALAALALMCVFDGAGKQRIRRRAIACIVGAIVGAMPALASRLVIGPNVAQSAISLDRIGYNARLLWNRCLPFALGYALYQDSEFPLRRSLWTAPMPWQVLQIAGGWSLLLGIVLGGAFIRSKLSWRVRRLGLFGFLVTLTTLAAFLVSVMPVDMWAVRYLAPIFWTAPFALAPLAARWGTRRFAIALAPYLLVALVGGWLSYGFRVHGLMPVLSTRDADRDQRQLCEFLRARGIHYAAADYWIAYRLTFLWHENPVVVPLDPLNDRYAPYRRQFLDQRRTALIFHPVQSRQDSEPFERYLRNNHIAYEVAHAGPFTVLIVDRADIPANPSAPGSQTRLLP